MGVSEIQSFHFSDKDCVKNRIGSVIDCGEFSSFVLEDCLITDSNCPISLNSIECFYSFKHGQKGFYDIKVFYKTGKDFSLARTDNHEYAKRWIEEANEFLKKTA